jgi:hypothetical protein
MQMLLRPLFIPAQAQVTTWYVASCKEFLKSKFKSSMPMPHHPLSVSGDSILLYDNNNDTNVTKSHSKQNIAILISTPTNLMPHHTLQNHPPTIQSQYTHLA